MNRLRRQEVNFFEREGYLMLPEVFSPDDLTPLREALSATIDREARRLMAAGVLSQLYEDEPFERRLTRIYSETEEILLPIVGRAGGGYSEPALFNIITHPKLVAVVEDFVGPEIVGSSVYRIRPKIPGMASGVVPWHQDSGYFSPHCDENLILTVWIPLVDATPENGCLQVLPRSHKQGVVRHHTGGAGGLLIIADEDLPATGAPVWVPVPLGGVLFMTNRTAHCSTPNTTDVVRWSIDLRYQSAEVPNNLGEQPEEFDSSRPDYEIACYPPEADFVVQSHKHPESVVATADAFNAIRQPYEKTRPPSPQRGWQPLGD